MKGPDFGCSCQWDADGHFVLNTGGINFGAPLRVLWERMTVKTANTPQHIIVSRAGHTAWYQVGSTKYYPAEMWLLRIETRRVRGALPDVSGHPFTAVRLEEIEHGRRGKAVMKVLKLRAEHDFINWMTKKGSTAP